jgi:uncharacterized protein
VILKQFHNAKEYLNRVEDFLMKDEALNILPLGIIYSLAESEENTDSLLVLIEDENGSQLVMIRTTKKLVVYGEGAKLDKAINKAVDYLIDNKIEIPGVIGPIKIATRFAEQWEKMNKSSIKVSMNQRLYRLDKVNEVEVCEGRFRVAVSGDLDTAAEWTYDFTAEALEGISMEAATAHAEYSIRESILYLWEDGVPVSIASKAKSTKNGVVLNLVYTPLELRGKGYATNCVAALSQKLLNDGYKFCSLFTDLSNPTSNDIYSKIGYNPIADFIVYDFCE